MIDLDEIVVVVRFGKCDFLVVGWMIWSFEFKVCVVEWVVGCVVWIVVLVGVWIWCFVKIMFKLCDYGVICVEFVNGLECVFELDL